MLMYVSGAAGTGGLCAQVPATVETEDAGPVSEGRSQQSIFCL